MPVQEWAVLKALRAFYQKYRRNRGKRDDFTMKVISLFIATLLSTFPFIPHAWSQGKPVAGWVEKIRIYPENLLFDAKMDTGAENSSLDARNIKEFDHNGQLWVRFEVQTTDGERKTLERKFLRTASVKTKGGDPQKRPVVILGICLGDYYKKVEVNLVDRSKFDHRMLVGRSFMEGKFVVDPSAQYTLQSNCKDAPRQ